jgi:hypothetical protein
MWAKLVVHTSLTTLVAEICLFRLKALGADFYS